MLFDEMTLKDNSLNLDVKKTCYPNPVKIHTIYRKNRCNMHVITK
jgi:hypothetical protein